MQSYQSKDNQIICAGKWWKTYALLSELTGTLVLSVTQQLNDTALVGSKTDNLTGNLADELGAAGRLALGTADLGLGGVQRGGFLCSSLARLYSRFVSHANSLFRIICLLYRFLGVGFGQFWVQMVGQASFQCPCCDTENFPPHIVWSLCYLVLCLTDSSDRFLSF